MVQTHAAPTQLLPCQKEPEPFFPDSVGAHNYDRAKRLCDDCPLATRLGCLDFALENNERTGVWGGKSPKERDAIVAERKAASGDPTPPRRRRGRRA